MTAPSLFGLLRPPSGRFAPRLCLTMRGGAPPLHPGGILQGQEPLRPLIWALRPSTPGVCEGLAAPTPPDLGAPPQTPGDFRFTTKVTKGVPGLRPWTPGTKSPPFSRSLRCAPARAGLVSATEKDRFATLSWVGKSVLFFPLVSSREHSVFSIRGSAGGMPPRMLEGLSSRNQYR